MNSRHSARRQPSGNRTGAALSPWHLVGLGLVALLGTGILAAMDRSDERAASAHTDLNRPQRKGDVAQVASNQVAMAQAAPVAETAQAPVIASVRAPLSAPLPGRPGTAQAAVPTSGAGNGIASATPRPAEASVAPSPAAKPAFVPAPPTVAEQRPQPTEGPLVTASLSHAVPPARPAIAAAPEGAATRGLVKTDATASTDCLPAELRAVVADLAARFGEVTVVSTHQLNTVNHSAGSIREKLHTDCKALDIRPDRSRIDEIKAYLRTRPEIRGIESYRNGIVHMDVSGTSAARTRPGRAQASAQAAPADALQAAPPLPQPPQATTPFTPAIPDRDR